MELYYIFNPLHPDISMHILHTVIYTFPIEKMRRTFLLIKCLIGWCHFLLVILMVNLR